jgi:hypothetical protein
MTRASRPGSRSRSPARPHNVKPLYDCTKISRGLEIVDLTASSAVVVPTEGVFTGTMHGWVTSRCVRRPEGSGARRAER